MNHPLQDSTVIQLSPSDLVLLWPIHISHSSDNRETCSGCFLTPVSPVANARDVSDSRLQDKLNVKLLASSDCHALLGERVKTTSTSWADVNRTDQFDMFPIFDRYIDASNSDHLNIFGYFKAKYDLSLLRKASIKLFSEPNTLTPNLSLERRNRVINAIKSQKAPLIIHTVLTSIVHEYNSFQSIDNYITFIENLKKHLHCPNVPNCVNKSSKKLLSMYLFQQAYPFCIAFVNGNHRHCRFIFDELMLKRNTVGNILSDSHIDGYVIPIIPDDRFEKRVEYNLTYHFYTFLDNNTRIFEHHLESISESIDNIGRNTVANETCHR
jgi:hypothetical protein